MIIALVEQVAHHPGHIHNAVLGLLGVNVHQRVDIVQRVHNEVRVDLVTQVVKLLLQTLLLELGQMLFLLFTLAKGFHT